MSTEVITVGSRVRGYDPVYDLAYEGRVVANNVSRAFDVRWVAIDNELAPCAGLRVALPTAGLVIPEGHRACPEGTVYPPLEVVA